jgi:hypothetical protein
MSYESRLYLFCSELLFSVSLTIYICIFSTVTTLVNEGYIIVNRTFDFIYFTGTDMAESALSSDESIVFSGDLGNLM